jgi:hypothetical protein
MTERLDEPVRTKVLKLSPSQDDMFRRPIEQLRGGELTSGQYQGTMRELLSKRDLRNEFATSIKALTPEAPADWLVRRHIGPCRYTVQVYLVATGEVHPPHHHHNLISTQVVLEGKIHLREYRRIRRDDEGRLVLRLVRDEQLGAGDMFQVSEWTTNVHWFAAIDGPAKVFAIDARGFEAKTFDQARDEGYGRRYVDPTNINGDGLAVCECLDKDEAARRFGGRSLSEFPVPGGL